MPQYEPASSFGQSSSRIMPDPSAHNDRSSTVAANHQNYPAATNMNGTSASSSTAYQLGLPQPSPHHQDRRASTQVYSSYSQQQQQQQQQSPNSRKRASHSITTATATAHQLAVQQAAPPLPSSSNPFGHSTNANGQPSSGTVDVYQHPAALAFQAAHPRRKIPQFGPYLLLQTLGEGEFGKVKLGLHSEWGEEVAVKLIRRGSVDSSARMIKVEREIEVLRLIRHPNIVRLYDVIETDKFIGIVLEYASGGELFDHILAHRYLRERDASKLFAQLISGVWYCHKKKIVHRDLKLENLLLDRNRNVIITDFGFANHFAKKGDDQMQTSCGSPCYAAPELVISEGLYTGSAVDVWSCGVILYAMLAGYLPFDDDPDNPDGDNINLLYKYIVSTHLTFPEYVSHEARDLLKIMLVPDPRHRATLEQVMAHPWLGAFTPLFRQSVKELESAAHQQQQEKRQHYLRQMRDRAQSTDASATEAPGSLGRSGTTTGFPDQSMADHQQQPIYSTSPTQATRARPVTTSVTLASTSPVLEEPQNRASSNDFPFIPEYSIPVSGSASSGMPTAGSGERRSRKESTKSQTSKAQRPSTGAVPPSPSPSTIPTSPSKPSNATATPTSPQTEKKRRPGAGQRHTIQLEYVDSGNGGTTLSTPRASGERTPVATAYAPAEQLPPTPSQPPTTQTPAKSGKKATRPDSDGIDTLHYDPFTTEPIPRDLFREPSPAAVAAYEKQQKQDTPRESAVPERSASGSGRPITTSTSSPPPTSPSTGKPKGPAYTPAIPPSAKAPGDSPPKERDNDVASSMASLSIHESSPTSATVSRDSSTRHRRGGSVDKFGPTPPSSAAAASYVAAQQQQQQQGVRESPSGGSTSSERSRPPTAGGSSKKSGSTLPGLRNRLSGRLSRRQSADVASVGSDKSAREKDSLHQLLQQKQKQEHAQEENGGKKKRRTTISLMIDPLAKMQKGLSRRGKTSETPTSTAHPNFRSTALSPIEQGPPPALPTPAPTPAPSSAPSSTLAKPQRTGSSSYEIPPHAGGTLPSRLGPQPSSGKAKTVMEWFRKKSRPEDDPDAQTGFYTPPTNPSAPKLLVTDSNASTATAVAAPPPSVSAPPSSWAKGRGITNGSGGLLQAPNVGARVGRAASTTRDAGGAAAAATTTAAGLGVTIPPPRYPVMYHSGPTDPAMVVSGVNADVAFEHILKSVRALGIEPTLESAYKAICVRPDQSKKDKKGARTSLAAFSLNGFGGSSGTDRRGLPLPSHNSVAASSSGTGGFKGYLFRRGSSQAYMPTASNRPQAPSTAPEHVTDAQSLNPSISAQHSTDSMHTHDAGDVPSAPALIEPVYGEKGQDKRGEVQFSVELTQLSGLADTYAMDIRRVKGDQKSYGFVYSKFKSTCAISTLKP